MKKYEIIAIYNQTNEEKLMCLRAKQDAIKRGRKCFVNIPTSGTHKGMLCLWMHKEHIAKGRDTDECREEKTSGRAGCSHWRAREAKSESNELPKAVIVNTASTIVLTRTVKSSRYEHVRLHEAFPLHPRINHLAGG